MPYLDLFCSLIRLGIDLNNDFQEVPLLVQLIYVMILLIFIEGYTWSYNNAKEDVILVCDYYEKVNKKEKIVELSDGSVMTSAAYEKFTQEWEKKKTIAQLPVVVKKRKTNLIKVVRYRLMETQIIDYHETIFKGLPFIFVDGDSEYIRNGNGMPVEQFTKPYAWHVIGIQKLKNFAAQTWAN